MKLYAITPGQCRAARALLDLTQPQLADLAGLGLSTIVDFEKSRRDISLDAAEAIQRALEKAGVKFIAKRCGTGRAPTDLKPKLWFLRIASARQVNTILTRVASPHGAPRMLGREQSRLGRGASRPQRSPRELYDLSEFCVTQPEVQEGLRTVVPALYCLRAAAEPRKHLHRALGTNVRRSGCSISKL
jgi:transcriptional regulator with XRE-family HTH domain